MKKFTSIGSLYNVIHHLRNHAQHIGVRFEEYPSIDYVGTVKLHGTNARVAVVPALNAIPKIVAGSREHELSADHDNAGWFYFVNEVNRSMFWKKLAIKIKEDNKITDELAVVTIFGEWCGGSIQKGVALNKCPKHFVIFGAAVNDVMVSNKPTYRDPAIDVYNVQDVVQYKLTLDCADPHAFSEKVNAITIEVEERCPWAYNMFGVDGIGEGVVWTAAKEPNSTALYFKSKGEKHAVRQGKAKNVAPVDVEKVESIKECVSIMLTENRMKQMINDHNIALVNESIGQFIKLVAQDCLKEELNLIVSNNLEWKDVVKVLNFEARIWFKDFITRSNIDGNS